MAAALTSNCLIAGFLTLESQNPFSHYARKNIARKQWPLIVQTKLHAPAVARQIFLLLVLRYSGTGNKRLCGRDGRNSRDAILVRDVGLN